MAVTPRAVELYREGMAIPRRKIHERNQVSGSLADELRADVCLPCLLEPSPVFLLAPPIGRDAELVAAWHELKTALEAQA